MMGEKMRDVAVVVVVRLFSNFYPRKEIASEGSSQLVPSQF
jgi:hypothetical protein